MKELIDIPDELYEAYKGRPPRTGDEGMDMIAQAIANGTPLQDGEFLLTLMQSVMTPEQLNEVLQKVVEQKNEWIPITMRPLEEEEKFVFPYATFIFDCPMPENGQDILISTKYGVEFDTCYEDDGFYLDSDKDWEEVYAWQPLPEPYKKEGTGNG